MQLFLVLTVHSEGCLSAPWQAVSPSPAQSNAFFWYNTSGSYPDSFLPRHGWGWGLICLEEEPFPLEDFSVSEVTLVDKVYCWVHGLREWLSVIHFTVVFIWHVDATVFLSYVIRPICYILHLLSSWCAPHHANGDAASEPDPGTILLGGGGHHLSLVSDHHPATGGVSLPHQKCLQVRLLSLHYVHDDKHRAWNLSTLFTLYISSPHALGNMMIEHMCSRYPKSKVTFNESKIFELTKLFCGYIYLMVAHFIALDVKGRCASVCNVIHQLIYD